MAKNTTVSKTKLPLIPTIGLVALYVIALTVLNHPQCPSNYAQGHVKTYDCVVGANIGLGLFIILLMPLTIFVGILWAVAITRYNKKPTKKVSKSRSKAKRR